MRDVNAEVLVMVLVLITERYSTAGTAPRRGHGYSYTGALK